MILFARDWGKYPNARPDYETSNKSFYDLAVQYRDMGIENHLFLLALHDQSLKGVDPFAKDLDIETKGKIAIECKINPWYYFREIARVPGNGGEEAIPIQANRGNIALWWCFFNHITTFLIQIRQTGKSLSVDELAVYLMEIRCRNTVINLLTKDESLRKNNIARLKEIDAELPAYLRQRGKDDANNTEIITVNKNNNRLLTHLPQASPKLANNVGRGFTSPITFVDEGPFQPNIDIALPAALAAGNNVRERAARAGEPYGNILTTTAGKKDEKGGAFFYNLLCESAPWSEGFFDAYDYEALEALVRKIAPGGKYYMNITLNHKQLGKTDAWLKNAIETTAGITADMADRDFFNRWTSGSISSPLSIDDLERIRNSERNPDWVDVNHEFGYRFEWFIPKKDVTARMANGKYLICIDPSEAIGRDAMSFYVMDTRSGECICAATVKETMVLNFAHYLAEFMIKYENTIAVIERKSTGITLIEHLLIILPSRNIDPVKRIYNVMVNNADEYPELFAECRVPMGRRNPHFYAQTKRYFGFATAGSGANARSFLYGEVLQNAAKQLGDVVYHKTTIDQITSLITKNNRVDHPNGGNDDHVVAWLLGAYVLMFGKQLAYYDINVAQILSARKSKMLATLTPEQQYVNKQQEQYRAKLEALLELLNEENDQFLVARYEQQARHLDSLIERRDNESVSVDDLIRKTKEAKRINRNSIATNQIMANGGLFSGRSYNDIGHGGYASNFGNYGHYGIR